MVSLLSLSMLSFSKTEAKAMQTGAMKGWIVEASRIRRLIAGVVLIAALAAPGVARAWSWPVDGAVLRTFDVGSNPYAGGQHRGIDIGGDLAATVKAAAGGRVTFVGTVPHSGLVVAIATADGYSVTLTHLGSATVK